MKYILINLIVFVSLSQAVEKFIPIKPVSIEYAPVEKERVALSKPVVEQEEDEFDENAQNMWSNGTADDSFDIDNDLNEDANNDANDESEQNSSVCQTISGFTVDKDGCPQTYILSTKFDNKKTTLKKGMTKELKEFSEFLKKHLSYQVLIYSYTDSIGEEKENKLVTQKRAKIIKKILLDYGIASIKLTAIGKGEKEPLESNINKSGRDKNNRVEIALIK